jgi:uncharacterized protein YjbI with pentapeptide repeats
MADEEHVKRLKQDVLEWNQWRLDNPRIRPDLTAADLHGVHLDHADLSGANLSDVNLSGARLERANLGLEKDIVWSSHFDVDRTNLFRANLSDANLAGAKLAHADLKHSNLERATLFAASLFGADLSDADLSDADLIAADLTGARLNGAHLKKALLGYTGLANADLSGVTGLEQCVHRAPSIIDHRTLQNSGPLPLAFLRGVGLPDNLIEYLPSIFNQAIQHYSCFIS